MKTILVIEDEPSNLEIFAALLWSKGYKVLEASTATEALDAAERQGNIDLLVCDVSLRGESGTAVARELVQKQRDLPVLFVTGTPQDAWHEADKRNLDGLAPAAVEVLEKPFLPATFGAAVERLSRRAAARPMVAAHAGVLSTTT
jgi:two-component system cell cycle sensor histidine kinase/response regulator CckA